jgi:putative ABC transport system permease protein
MGYNEPGDACGEFIKFGRDQYRIIGVVEDYHHLSLKSELMPVVFFKSLQWRYAVGFYSLKMAYYDQATIEMVAAAWKDIYPGEQYIYNSLEDTYAEQYAAERSFALSFMIAALLAILISAMGLSGMSKYNAMKRTKEIGIRKTFGSTSLQVLKLLQYETVLLVLIASLVGIPLSWYIMKQWLANFTFHIDPAWWMFALAGLLALLIAMLTILTQTWKVSRTNPVETLRYE